MGQSQVDLADLFAVAQQSIAAHQREINDLDGYNGNHGDNTTQNMELIVDALQQRRDQPPAAALEYASQRMQTEGRGGTSQYYAQGLSQAASQLQGRSGLTSADAISLVQSLLGAIPTEGHPQQPQAGGSVLDQVLGMTQTQPTPRKEQGSPLGGLLKSLLPAVVAYFGTQQPGGDATAAAGQALIGALTGSQEVNPLQSGTPRAAAGGLVAQSILKALLEWILHDGDTHGYRDTHEYRYPGMARQHRDSVLDFRSGL
jgi:hypothetical protein